MDAWFEPAMEASILDGKKDFKKNLRLKKKSEKSTIRLQLLLSLDLNDASQRNFSNLCLYKTRPEVVQTNCERGDNISPCRAKKSKEFPVGEVHVSLHSSIVPAYGTVHSRINLEEIHLCIVIDEHPGAIIMLSMLALFVRH